MCHPGYPPEAVKSGYSAQREVELATFLHPRAREALSRAGSRPHRLWRPHILALASSANVSSPRQHLHPKNLHSQRSGDRCAWGQGREH